jgi:hypothetical protein
LTDSITAINTNTKSVMDTDSLNASHKISIVVCNVISNYFDVIDLGFWLLAVSSWLLLKANG